jgi:hypothetical protein
MGDHRLIATGESRRCILALHEDMDASETIETAIGANHETPHANLSRLQCRQPLLTHLGKEMLARRGAPGVTCAGDGMVIEI